MKALLFLMLGLAFLWPGLLHAEDFPGLKEPLKTVTAKYLVIEKKLTTDSFDGVTVAATEMKAAMAAAPKESFAPDFMKAVDVLAGATDLHTARVAFQDVSNCLIAALAENQVQTGSLHSVFCPMRKAYWIQVDGKKIENPYYGSAMLDCGEFQRQF